MQRSSSKRHSQSISNQPVSTTTTVTRRASQTTASSFSSEQQYLQRSALPGTVAMSTAPAATATASHGQVPLSVIADHFQARSSLAAGQAPTEHSVQRTFGGMHGLGADQVTQRLQLGGHSTATTDRKQHTTGATKPKSIHATSRTKPATVDRKEPTRWHLPSVIRTTEGLFHLTVEVYVVGR